MYVSAYWAEETIAFDAATGDVVWRVDERLADPVVAGETVYCAGADGIVALDTSSGDRRGRFGTDLGPQSGVDTLVVAGDRLYVAFASVEDEPPAQTVFALEAP